MALKCHNGIKIPDEWGVRRAQHLDRKQVNTRWIKKQHSTFSSFLHPEKNEVYSSEKTLNLTKGCRQSTISAPAEGLSNRATHQIYIKSRFQGATKHCGKEVECKIWWKFKAIRAILRVGPNSTKKAGKYSGIHTIQSPKFQDQCPQRVWWKGRWAPLLRTLVCVVPEFVSSYSSLWWPCWYCSGVSVESKTSKGIEEQR